MNFRTKKTTGDKEDVTNDKKINIPGRHKNMCMYQSKGVCKTTEPQDTQNKT